MLEYKLSERYSQFLIQTDILYGTLRLFCEQQNDYELLYNGPHTEITTYGETKDEIQTNKGGNDYEMINMIKITTLLKIILTQNNQLCRGFHANYTKTSTN